MRLLLCGTAAAFLATSAQAVITNLLPVQKGAVVATCFSSSTSFDYLQDPNGFVVLMVDASSTELGLAPLDIAGLTHNWKKFHNEVSVQNGLPNANREWTAGNLGEVFGITFDDASNPNVYVAASTVYGAHPYPAGNGPGTVYRLDSSTGNITPFNCIPNGGAALGNLTYWKASNGTGHLYVTSMDDGLIYQLDLAGNCVGTFDHGVSARPNEGLAAQPDDPTGNYTQRGRRLWGIEAYQGRLYYGVWTTTGTEVWSVGLDAAGVPQAATAQLDIPASSFNTNYPVSDIAFSNTGELFTAHRYHRGLNFGGQHQAGVYEFVFGLGTWDNPSPTNKWRLGNFWQNTNSAGGVDVECTGAVWASSDAINYPSPAIYGAQRMPPGGNTADVPATLNSHVLDYDNISKNLKTYLGDIEIYDPCEECFDITEIEIQCPPSADEPYHVTFKITNRSNQTAHYIWHTPCDPADIPQGGLGGQPNPVGPQALPTPLATGDCATVSVDIHAPLSGGKFYWNITLLNESGGECCTDKACIELPDCDCFIVLDKSVECTVDAAGILKYTLNIKLQNTSTFAWYHANLLPPGLFNPPTFDLSASPVPPGGIHTITTCVTGNPGDIVCFSLSVHSEDIDECCAKECCITLPPCEGGKPDECNITQVAPCCPQFPGGPSFANAVLTICNNSPVSRTYSWNMTALPIGPGCDAVLPLGNAAFIPPNGSVTVGPNSCVNINIAIDCEGLPAGKRACYEACVRETGNPNNTFCCDGKVFVPVQPDPVIKADPGGGNPGAGVVLVPGAAVRHTVEVMNPSDRAVRYVFEVASLGEVVDIAAPLATSPDFQSVQRLVVDLEPFETEIVSMDLRAQGGLSFDNTLIPLVFYPLSAEGVPQATIYSTFVLLPVQQGGEPALKGIAYNEDGTFTMTLAVNPGRTYRIESSRSLGSIDPWGPVTCSTVMNGHEGTEFTAVGTLLELIITPDPTCPDNFFRAVELP